MKKNRPGLITHDHTSTGRREQMRYILTLAMIAISLIMSQPLQAQDADEAKDEEQEEAGISPEMLGKLADSFVAVKIYFKRNKKEASGDHDWGSSAYERSSRYEAFIEQKRPMRLGGVAVSKNQVMIYDVFLDDEYLDYIEVENLKGETTRVERFAILKNTPAMLLKTKADAGMDLSPPEFGQAPEDIDEDTELFGISLEEKGIEYMVQSNPMGAGHVYLEGRPRLQVSLNGTDIGSDSSSYHRYRQRGMDQLYHTPSLILDADHKAIGVGILGKIIIPGDENFAWKIQDLDEEARIAFEDWQQLQTKTKDQYKDLILETRVAFRQKAEDDSYSYNRWSSDAGDIAEIYLYGLPISKTQLFIPNRIQREQAKIIDTITIFHDGKEIEAIFSGAYQTIGGFVVETKESVLPYDASVFSQDSAPRISPMITVLPQRKFGGKFMEMGYDRYLHDIRGYKDIPEPVPTNQLTVGSYYMDRDRKIRAMMLEQRKEDEDKDRFRQDPDGYYYGGRVEFRRMYTMSELMDLFQNPAAHYDKTIVWLPEKEEKRKMWFGVEFQAISPDLAKHYEIEKQTLDGKIGLIVSTVYPDSPADKLGIDVGHVLLKLQEGEEDPIDLRASSDDYYGLRRYYGMDFSGDYRSYRDNRPWPTRETMLTKLLEVIGEGKKATIIYLDDDFEKQNKEFTIQEAPQDFANAEKYKDEAAGLTVKNITYEVRYTLKLSDDFGGVVIADIEEGSPAAVARAGFSEIVTQIDDQLINDVKDYERIMEEAVQRLQDQEKVTLRFTLQYLDKTHFADITIQHSDLDGSNDLEQLIQMMSQ